MKRLSTHTLLLGLLFAMVCPATAQLQTDGPIEVNGIAAKVNGRVITKNKLSFMLSPIFSQLAAKYPRRGQEFQLQLKEAKDNILQELIDREIILDEFKKIGANIDPNAVDAEIKRQINSLYNGDKSKFNEELRKSRLTMDGYREMTREKMIVQAMRAQQFSDAPPPLPNEIRDEYNRMKNDVRESSKDVISFRKIFIPASDANNPAVTRDSQLALAEEIAADLKAGKDFAELAKAHSKDAYAELGGLQENVPRPDLSAEFAAIIFDGKEGDIIGPLVDPYGFTIVKPLKIKLGPAPTLGEIRDVVEERVRKKKTSEQYERWIELRRKRAMIVIKV